MNEKMPRTPFSTPLSGSAREAELRLKNIFSGPKKRPPVLFLALIFAVCLLCGNLVSCQVAQAEPQVPDGSVDLSQTDEAEWRLTAGVTVFPQRPDLNRNGVPEEVRLYVPAEYGSSQQLEIWEDGKRIFQETGNEAHVGWNAIFLCTLEGEDCLLRYHPTMYQGGASYVYKLFTLEGDTEHIVQENEVSFEVNFGMPTPDGGVVDPAQLFDPEAVAGFMEEINGLLSHSVQLLNTDQDLLSSFEREGRLEDTLWFLDIDPELFTSDPQKSLRENIQDYYRTMAELFPGREGSGQPPEEPADSAPAERGIMPFDRPLELYFLSGAGGWSTDLRILPDGSFVGNYHDSDMGDGGKDYPRGIQYVCSFHGKFKDVISVSEHVWSLTLAELTLDTGHPVGEEWIEDDVRYVSSDPYGFNRSEGGALEPGARFMLYSPQARGYAPTDELYGMNEDSPDSNLYEFWSWWPNRHAWGPDDTLDCWGLRSLSTGYGFFSEM